ncbi:hypothetical protein [Acidaminococcus fermentans]|uniref:hypothetical protein n=1 Tax=Acidaminococcus fermentans TaxID=905 RepID=UPI0005A2DA7A|nr:hypothetical protein [Acidaminococcus fermentans]MCF0138750.1 hypothetical protein [Acidaminococcus fermentans]MCI6285635.1 hypothetical protein [Acidaminococcus fermentans]MCI7195027.1 hypothetical protein [Acidaminococcus fermentans]MDD7195408.1 hypothetical protein [Acidaminococcus fermentans]MDY2852252.1 hypothetical protein [Acidaminococcus fermentans]
MTAKFKTLAVAAAFFAAGSMAGPRLFSVTPAHAAEAAGGNQSVVQALDNQVGCPYYNQNGRHWRGGRRGRGGCWNQGQQPPCWGDDGQGQGQQS